MSKYVGLLFLVCLVTLVAGCGGSQDVAVTRNHSESTKIYNWKLITTWPKNLPGLGMAPERLADDLREMSNGRLDIKVFGAGELVPGQQVFESVSQGAAEMGHGAAYYWVGKAAIAPMFSTVPFGMNAQEMNSWLHYGGGLELWRELYEPFGLRPFACGNSGVQMAGWFNKEIRSLDDIKGLKMRIPGFGGEVLKRADGVPVKMMANEIYTSLQTGVIDATEWVGPFNDLALGLHTAAKYYYFPGWHEPGPTLELIVNQEALDSLPPDLQKMIEVASRAINDDMLSEFTAHNNASLETLVNEHGVEIRALPDDVIRAFKGLSREVDKEAAEKDEMSRRIYYSYMAFLEDVRSYHAISEQAYFNAR